MGFQNVIHGGGAPSDTTSVYYTGSDTLLEGYALCYDFYAADVNQEDVAQTSPNVGEECWADARRLLVEKCDEGNKIHFAGVVAKDSDGIIGPGWIKIHKPGSICNVFVDADCDHEISAGCASGQIVNVTVGQYYMTDGGFLGKGAAMVLQDVDRDTTNDVIMAELMTGAPSGGYCIVAAASAGTLGAISTLISNDWIHNGHYEFTTSGSGCISGAIGTGDGKYIGQRLRIHCTAAATNNLVTRDPIVVSSGWFPNNSGTLGKLSLITVGAFSVAVGFSLANTLIDMEYDGRRWVMKSVGSTTVLSF